jgi:hypothetical protein
MRCDPRSGDRALANTPMSEPSVGRQLVGAAGSGGDNLPKPRRLDLIGRGAVGAVRCCDVWWRKQETASDPLSWNFLLAQPDTSSPEETTPSGKGADVTRLTKSTTRRVERMFFALTAAGFMVCAHPEHLTKVAGPPAQVGGLPDAIDEMPTIVGVSRGWEWCPTLLNDPEMVDWRTSRGEWLALVYRWCLKPVVVRDRARARGHRDGASHR